MRRVPVAIPHLCSVCIFALFFIWLAPKITKKDEKCIVIIRNADKLRMQNTKYKSHIIKYQSLACVIRYRENTTPNFTFFGCKIGYQSYKRLIFRNYFGTYGTWILICNKTFSKWLISNLKSRINWTKRTGNNSHELTIVPESISKDFST